MTYSFMGIVKRLHTRHKIVEEIITIISQAMESTKDAPTSSLLMLNG